MTDCRSTFDEVQSVKTGEDLAVLVRRQHEELRAMLCRVSLLHDGAREDVFLRARRLLAVHLELEAAVLLPRLGGMPEHFRLDEEIEAAEAEGMESLGFDAAQARVAVAFLRHRDLVEGLSLSGPLSDRDEEAVAAAVRLWDGQGDAYLGNTWSDMVTAVSEQVAGISD